MISRRDVLKTLIVSVGGTSLLSACGGQVTLGALAPGAPPRFYSEREMALLSRVSDLLLPRTETPGALDVQVPALLDKLMNEWANADTQAAHHDTLATLDARLRTQLGGDFLAAGDGAARETLAAVDEAAFAGEPIEGYRNLKGLITQAYFATEAGALQEAKWVAVPGRWEPCVDVT